MSTQWFFSRDGRQFGPYSSADLRTLANNGSLSPDDQVRRGDSEEWAPASSVGGLFSAGTPAPAKPQPVKANRSSGITFAGLLSVVAGGFKWVFVFIAAIFALMAITAEMAPGGAQAAGVACFFGICARLCQVEQYTK